MTAAFRPSSAAVDAVLRNFPNAKQVAGGWQVKCPAHDDLHASLSVSMGDDGRALLKCHAGCSTDDILFRIGLTMPDLFPVGTSKSRASQIAMTYDYVDPNGTLLYQAVRKDPKGFFQRRPDGAGGWINKLNGMQRVPYRLPEVLAAVQAGTPIYITEGEKDVDNLRALGLVASCNPEGALKWHDYFAPHFQGADVVIIPDNDDPGRAHAEQVAVSLASVARSIKVVHIPGLSDKGDVSDWLKTGGTRAGLEQLAAAAPEWAPSAVPPATPPPPASSPPSAAAKPNTQKPKPDLLDASHLWAKMYGAEWAYDPDLVLWRHWTGTYWEEESRTSTTLDTQAALVLRRIGMPVSSAGRLDGVIRLAASVCTRTFTPRPGLINFRNGTLDTATMTLRSHDRVDNLTSFLNYDWSPGTMPAIDQFLADTIPDSEARYTYQAHVGLALLGDTKFHKALLAIGPPRSGKSTLIGLANLTCGYNPANSAGPELFDRETEGLRSRARWNGRRMVTLEELPVEALRNEEIIKAMVAHGGVAQRRLHREELIDNQWLPKLMMATNHAPRYTDHSGALTQRLIVVRCPNARDEKDRDLNLLDKLIPELGAFAAACLMQAFTARGAGRYPESAEMRQELAEIEHSGDAMKSFVLDECILEADAWIDSANLYAEYRTYCTDNGQTPMSKNRFTQSLCERFRSLEPKGKNVGKPAGGTALTPVWTRGIKGIRMRVPTDPHPEEDQPTANLQQPTANLQQKDETCRPDLGHQDAVSQQQPTAPTAENRISSIEEDTSSIEKNNNTHSAVGAVGATTNSASESHKTDLQQTGETCSSAVDSAVGPDESDPKGIVERLKQRRGGS